MAFKKGHKVSEETRKKMSIAHKGQPSYRKGKYLSEEIKRKISEAIKISHARPEIRMKMHLAHLGKSSPRKGKSFTEEQKKKISQKTKEAMAKPEVKVKLGHLLSENTKQKIRNAHNTPKNRKKFSELMRKTRLRIIIPSKDTKIEVKVQQFLMQLGIKFIKHKPIFGQPDIFIEPNICIFADGCYWHGCEICFNRNNFNERQRGAKVRDAYVTQFLINTGYKVLRFWEHDINNNINELRKVEELYVKIR